MRFAAFCLLGLAVMLARHNPKVPAQPAGSLQLKLLGQEAGSTGVGLGTHEQPAKNANESRGKIPELQDERGQQRR